MSHTYALLAVSDATYEEIATKLRDADYLHAFGDEGEIDMHGIALERSTKANLDEVRRMASAGEPLINVDEMITAGEGRKPVGPGAPCPSDVVAGENAAPEPTELPFVVLSEWAARSYCKVMGVEYAPVDGKQVVGGVMVHTLGGDA